MCDAIAAGNQAQAELLYPQSPDLLRAHRAGGRGLGHPRHRHRRPDRQPGDQPGRPRGLPQARDAPVGRRHPHRRRRLSAASSSTNEQQLQQPGRDRHLRPGDHGQRGHRPDQRGRHRQDHRRGGAVLEHRLHRVPGQRGRRHGGGQPAQALSAEDQPADAGLTDPAASTRTVESAIAKYKARPATTAPATSSTRPCSTPSAASSRPSCRPSPSRCPRCPVKCRD